MLKCEYYLIVMYTCLSVIDVFFYLNQYMCLFISYVGYILTRYWTIPSLGTNSQEEET